MKVNARARVVTASSSVRAWAMACAGFSILSACGGGADPGSEADAGTVFVAFERDFQNFRGWSAFPLGDLGAQGLSHLAGPRTVYLNRMPPPEATTFSVGTIIVKEMDGGELLTRQIFAMVKRGGAFNLQGARGWEWFELQNRDAASVEILWHGVGPPSGEKYGGDPTGGCNPCHTSAAGNDFVQSDVLKFDRLASQP